jgi:hypothetical protein
MKISHFTFFLILLSPPILSFAQPESDEKEIKFAFVENEKGNPGNILFLNESRYKNTYQYEVANKIFEALIEARGDFRMQKPKFKMSKSEREVAVAFPRKAEIILELKAYKVCTTFGKDSLNALAAILSHELIHYYEKHDWTEHFVAEHEGTSTGNKLKKIKERLKLETQSDYLGGFLAYSAGYQTLDIMPLFFDKVYKSYRLKDTLKGYPPLQERKQSATQSLEKLQSFIHIFETANYLTAQKQYEPAKLYFDYILTDFQSREIYNNVGVIAAQIGMQFIGNQNLKFGYPLELDVESRLKNGLRGNKENQLANTVLQEAIAYFEKAINLDEKYPIALINLACVHALLNNFDDAEYFARKALKLCDQPNLKKTKTDVFVLQGILADFQDDPKKAENLFQKAADSGNSLAMVNLKILKNQPLEAAKINATNASSKKDKIEGFSIDKAVVQLLLDELEIDKLVRVNKKTVCGIKRLEQSTLLVHLIDEDNYTFIQIADESYSKTTKSGIKNGSSENEILANYGAADQRIEISDGTYLVYFNESLIFRITEKGNVRFWGIFRITDDNE